MTNQTNNQNVNNQNVAASFDTENAAAIGQAPDVNRYRAEQNKTGVSNNFNQLYAEYGQNVRNVRAARLGLGEVSSKVSETFRVGANMVNDGIAVKFVTDAVIVNPTGSGEMIYVNGQWEAEGYLKALTELHTSRFVHVGVGYRVYKSNPAGNVKNFAAITASYPDKNDQAGIFTPKTGYVTLDWSEGVYSVGVSVTERPAAADYTLDTKLSWDRFHYEYVSYVKHIALDNILAGHKVMIMPRLHAKDDNGKLVLDENGHKTIDEVASNRFLDKYAQAFRLSGDEAKAYIKNVIETWVSKKVDGIIIKDARKTGTTEAQYAAIAQGVEIPVSVAGQSAEKMCLSMLVGKTIRVTGRTSDVVVRAEMVVDAKGIEYLTAMSFNGFFGSGMRHVELLVA